MSAEQKNLFIHFTMAASLIEFLGEDGSPRSRARNQRAAQEVFYLAFHESVIASLRLKSVAGPVGLASFRDYFGKLLGAAKSVDRAGAAGLVAASAERLLRVSLTLSSAEHLARFLDHSLALLARRVPAPARLPLAHVLDAAGLRSFDLEAFTLFKHELVRDLCAETDLLREGRARDLTDLPDLDAPAPEPAPPEASTPSKRPTLASQLTLMAKSFWSEHSGFRRRKTEEPKSLAKSLASEGKASAVLSRHFSADVVFEDVEIRNSDPEEPAEPLRERRDDENVRGRDSPANASAKKSARFRLGDLDKENLSRKLFEPARRPLFDEQARP